MNISVYMVVVAAGCCVMASRGEAALPQRAAMGPPVAPAASAGATSERVAALAEKIKDPALAGDAKLRALDELLSLIAPGAEVAVESDAAVRAAIACCHNTFLISSFRCIVIERLGSHVHREAFPEIAATLAALGNAQDIPVEVRLAAQRAAKKSSAAPSGGIPQRIDTIERNAPVTPVRAAAGVLSPQDEDLLATRRKMYIEGAKGRLDQQRQALAQLAQQSKGRIAKKTRDWHMATIKSSKRQVREAEGMSLHELAVNELMAFYAASKRASDAAMAMSTYSSISEIAENLPPVTWTEPVVEQMPDGQGGLQTQVVGESEHEFDISFWGSLFFSAMAEVQEMELRGAQRRAGELSAFLNQLSEPAMADTKRRCVEKLRADERMAKAQERMETARRAKGKTSPWFGPPRRK